MKTLRLTIAAALLVAPTLVHAHGSSWRCTVTAKWACGSGVPCYEVDVWSKVDFLARTYQRCNAKDGCTTFQATVSKSGNYTNVTIPDRGLMMQIEMSTAKFISAAQHLRELRHCAPERS